MANVFSGKPNLGFSLVEVVVALAIFGLSISLIELIITAVRADATVVNRIKARGLVLDQIEVLRNMDFDLISTGSFTQFIGDAWNSGVWEVQTIGSTKTVESLGTGEQILLVPGDRWNDSTLSGQVYVSSDSLSGYDVGLLLRAQDSDTRYRLRITSSGSFVEREVDGTVTILSTLAASLPTNTWETFSFGISGSTLTASVGTQNSVLTDVTPISPDGHMALWSQDGCCVAFDSIVVTSSKGNASWDFESAQDVVGFIPPDWTRLSVDSLPGGTALVEVVHISGTELKQATVTVEWSDRTHTRTESTATYITRYGLQTD